MGQSQTKKQIKYGNQTNPSQIEPTFDEQRKNKFVQERERDVQHVYHSEQPRVFDGSHYKKSESINNKQRSSSTQKTLQSLKQQRFQKDLRAKDKTLIKTREINRSQNVAQFFLNAIQLTKINCSLVHTIPMNYNIPLCQQRLQESSCSQKISDAQKLLKLIEEKNRMEIQQIEKFYFEDILQQSTDFIQDFIDEKNIDEKQYNIFKQERTKLEQSTRIQRKNNQQANNNSINTYSFFNKSESDIQNIQISSKEEISNQHFKQEQAFGLTSERVKQNSQFKEQGCNNKMKLSSLIKISNNSESNSVYNNSQYNQSNQNQKSERKYNSSNKENGIYPEYKISQLPKNQVLNSVNHQLINNGNSITTIKENNDQQYTKSYLTPSNMINAKNDKIQINNTKSNILNSYGYDKENSFCKPQSGQKKDNLQNLNNNYQNENKNFQNQGFLSERQYNTQYEIKNRLNSNTDYSEIQIRSKNISQKSDQKPISTLYDSENLSSDYIQEVSSSMAFQGREQRKIDVQENQQIFQQNQKYQPSYIISNPQTLTNNNIYLNPQSDKNQLYQNKSIISQNQNNLQSSDFKHSTNYFSQPQYIEEQSDIKQYNLYDVNKHNKQEKFKNEPKNQKMFQPVDQINNLERSRSGTNYQINIINYDLQNNKQQENKTQQNNKNLQTTYEQQIIANDSYQKDFQHLNNISNNQYINIHNQLNYQNDKQKDKKKIIQLNGKTYSKQSSNQNAYELSLNGDGINQQFQNNIQYNEDKQIQSNIQYLPLNQDYIDIIQSRKSSLNSCFSKNRQNILNELIYKKQKSEEYSHVNENKNNETPQTYYVKRNSDTYQNKQDQNSSTIQQQQNKHLQTPTKYLTSNKYQLDNSTNTTRKNSRNNMGSSMQRIQEDNYHLSDSKNNKLSGSFVFSSLLTQAIIKPKEEKFDNSLINKDYEEFVPYKVNTQSTYKSNANQMSSNLDNQMRTHRYASDIMQTQDSIIQMSKLDSKIKQLSDERSNSPFFAKHSLTPRQQSKLYF